MATAVQPLSSRSVAVLRPNPMARRILVCFPHAGGGASAYRKWANAFPPSVEVLAIRLPGRESRFHEPPLRSMAELVDEAVRGLTPHLSRPMVLVGHSMGAVVAYETAAALLERGLPSPLHLVLSARRPPWCPGREPSLSTLEDQAFLKAVQDRFGGIAPEILSEPELLRFVLSTLRADIRILEAHHRSAPLPVDCPVTALGGLSDRSVRTDELEEWRAATTHAFRIRQFRGDHFFLYERRDEVLGVLGGILEGNGRVMQCVGAKTPRAPSSRALEIHSTEMASTWPPPPLRPSLAPGDVHVFRAGLDVPDDRLQRLYRILAPAERARAGRFHHPRDVHRYVVGRATLRAVLARYLACTPAQVVVATEASGRPFLPSGRGGSLFFNLAHAGDLALVAVTGTGPIGVDVEEIYEIAEVESLADRFFSSEESRALREIPRDLRTAAFFRCWTRKEAVLKATGEGMAGDLSRFEVNLDPESARVVYWEGRPGRTSGWRLRHLAPAPGFVGALALRGPIRSVFTWSWPPDGRFNAPPPTSRRWPAEPRPRSTAFPESPHAEDVPAAK